MKNTQKWLILTAVINMILVSTQASALNTDNFEHIGIIVDHEKKEITLDGSRNPHKVLISGTDKNMPELSSFQHSQTGFPWNEYIGEEYFLIIKNTAITTYTSAKCISWFLATDFHVLLSADSYINNEQFENALDEAPRKMDKQSFHDLILECNIPQRNYYFTKGCANQKLLKKGYSIFPPYKSNNL